MDNRNSGKKEKILLVCTGNTCRSPMAEGILKKTIISDAKLSNKYEVRSAGLGAAAGNPVTSEAVNVLKAEWGIDISGHTANSICARDVRNAYLILTMEKAHKNILISNFPEMKDKIFTLKEYVGEEVDVSISDPYRKDYEVYKRCAHEIYINMDKLVIKLKKLAE